MVSSPRARPRRRRPRSPARIRPRPPLRPISSSLYGSSASSARASSSVTTRRPKVWPSLTIRCIPFSSAFRSSGVNGSRRRSRSRSRPGSAARCRAWPRVDLLHGLGQHVRGRVPQHRQAVRVSRCVTGSTDVAVGRARGPGRAARRRPGRRPPRGARAGRPANSSAAVVPPATDRSLPATVTVIWADTAGSLGRSAAGRIGEPATGTSLAAWLDRVAEVYPPGRTTSA